MALACPRNCWPLYSTPSPVQPALRRVPEPRWLPRSLREKPLGPGGPLCSHQEGGQLSGAEDGATSEALWLSPGRWPVVWSRRWRRLRSSLALSCHRNCWPLYSTPSPVQPALHRVPEPRWLPPGPEAENSWAGRTPVLSPGRWPVVWSRRWRLLRSSVAFACTRNGWPLYSTPSPMQPALHGVPEPRRLPPGPEAQTSRAGRTPVLSPGSECYLF